MTRQPMPVAADASRDVERGRRRTSRSMVAPEGGGLDGATKETATKETRRTRAHTSMRATWGPRAT